MLWWDLYLLGGWFVFFIAIARFALGKHTWPRKPEQSH